MKKPYKSLDIEVIMFEKKDVVTASGTDTQPVEHDNAYLNLTDF